MELIFIGHILKARKKPQKKRPKPTVAVNLGRVILCQSYKIV